MKYQDSTGTVVQKLLPGITVAIKDKTIDQTNMPQLSIVQALTLLGPMEFSIKLQSIKVGPLQILTGHR